MNDRRKENRASYQNWKLYKNGGLLSSFHCRPAFESSSPTPPILKLMASSHKNSLQELLQVNQDPFNLQRYIAERRLLLKKPTKKPTYKHAWDVLKFPLLLKRSPSGSRVQKQQPTSKQFSLFGSCLKDLGQKRKRAIVNQDQNIFPKLEEDFATPETQSYKSPFNFLGRTTDSPELFSSSGQEDWNKSNEEEEDDECSPVSTLDAPFDDYECYANIQRAKEKLLQRLKRFEKLADINSMELETETSDEEESEPIHDDIFLFNKFNFKNQILKGIEKKGKTVLLSNREYDFSRISNRLRKEVENIDGIYTMIDLDSGYWETKCEIVVEIFELLMDELAGEMFSH